MKRRNCKIVILILYVFASCGKEDREINLKWNKSYPGDTMAKNVVGLKWCLSLLGSEIASDTLLEGIQLKDSIININVDALKFPEAAADYLAELQSLLKETEEYQENNAIDLGRYIALTIGSPFHYYKIVDIPSQLNLYRSLHQFDTISGYINTSSVSKVHRTIGYSRSEAGIQRAFVSSELDSLTGEIYEYETVETMPNGQLKFGIYDINGRLKDAADTEISRAGKPAKCMWCHESGIQPILSMQRNYEGYLPYLNFKDSLDAFNKELRSFQESHWKDKVLKNRRLHTELEIAYIAFMEPSLTHIANEWQIPADSVRDILNDLATHRHHEFDFLGDLYHRKEIDALAPWESLPVPESIREKSENEINYLD